MVLSAGLKSTHMLVNMVSIANKLYSPLQRGKEEINLPAIFDLFHDILWRCEQSSISNMVKCAVNFLLGVVFKKTLQPLFRTRRIRKMDICDVPGSWTS